MTLLELVTHLRTSILDDVGGINVEWDGISEDDTNAAQLRWSNEELTRFINEAQKQACRSAFLLKSADATFQVAVTADLATYTLPSKIIRIKGIWLESTGKELSQIEYEDLMGITNWRTDTGTPSYVVVDYDTGTLRLYKTPLIDDTINILAYHLPLEDMDWNTAVIDTPEIREEYQIDMLAYAAHLAYQKDEANTFDPQRSEYFRQLFAQKFSDTSAYGDTRRRRTTGRTIRYGGY